MLQQLLVVLKPPNLSLKSMTVLKVLNSNMLAQTDERYSTAMHEKSKAIWLQHNMKPAYDAEMEMRNRSTHGCRFCDSNGASTSFDEGHSKVCVHVCIFITRVVCTEVVLSSLVSTFLSLVGKKNPCKKAEFENKVLKTKITLSEMTETWLCVWLCVLVVLGGVWNESLMTHTRNFKD